MRRAAAAVMAVAVSALTACSKPKARACEAPPVPAQGVRIARGGSIGMDYVVLDVPGRTLRTLTCPPAGADEGPKEATRTLTAAQTEALFALAKRAHEPLDGGSPEYPDWGIELSIADGAARFELSRNGPLQGAARELEAALDAATK